MYSQHSAHSVGCMQTVTDMYALNTQRPNFCFFLTLTYAFNILCVRDCSLCLQTKNTRQNNTRLDQRRHGLDISRRLSAEPNVR